MNRQERRLQEKLARRQHKPIRKVFQYRPTLDQVHLCFRPIDKFMEQLATGEIDVDRRGRAIHQDDDGECYESIPAVRGFVAAFRLMLHEHRMSIDMEPVIKLCNKLEASMPITPELVRQAHGIIDRCREAFRHMNAARVGDLVRTAQIRIELENMEAINGISQ